LTAVAPGATRGHPTISAADRPLVASVHHEDEIRRVHVAAQDQFGPMVGQVHSSFPGLAIASARDVRSGPVNPRGTRDRRVLTGHHNPVDRADARPAIGCRLLPR